MYAMDDSSIVVLNPPSGVSEDEFALHFQKKKNGGGYVSEVKLEKGVAFVIFVSLAGLLVTNEFIESKRLYKLRIMNYLMFP